MELRVWRTFHWVLAVPASEVRLGGRNPMILQHVDTLQYKDGNEWKTVPVVEDEKPEHPHDEEDRLRNEEMANGLRAMLDRAQKRPQE